MNLKKIANFFKPKKLDLGKLNMIIAQSYRLSGRLIGVQMTSGTLMAIALSSVQMAVGFTTKAHPASGVIWSLVFIIGIVMAILVERFTLGGLQAVYGAAERKTAYIDTREAMLIAEKREATELEANEYKKIKSRETWAIGIGWGIAVAGICLSVALGDEFWRLIFQNPVGIELVLPWFCASVVSATLVQSELCRALNMKSLTAIITDLHLPKLAVAMEEQQLQLDLMIDSYAELRADETVRGPAKDKIKKTLTRRLSGFADQVSIMADQAQAMTNLPGTTIESHPPQQLALPAPRGKYPLHRDELRRMYRANSNLSQRDVSKHFGVSTSTGNEWLRRVKAGQ